LGIWASQSVTSLTLRWSHSTAAVAGSLAGRVV
jgi:hypothetical protein